LPAKHLNIVRNTLYKMKTAKDILNEEIAMETIKMLLPDEVIMRKHNGIEYQMINEEIVLRAMEQYANQFKFPTNEEMMDAMKNYMPQFYYDGFRDCYYWLKSKLT
jgi:hypothetical protein